MRRTLLFALAALVGVLAPTASASPRPSCGEGSITCAEVGDGLSYGDEYIGHDEPSLLFYSDTAGSGNSNLYRLTLPKEPPQQPTQSGTGGTWNFQLHPAFWLGMALCDNQSAPEFTHDPCPADSDANIKNGSDPSQPDYIGRHAGAAFLELQFYPPGWAPWPAGISCDATKWCAAMAIFSLNRNYNTLVDNNKDCLNKVGLEPANFAFVTTSGVPHAAPDPLSGAANGSTQFVPNASTDLFMNQGDVLSVDIHDTFVGLQVVIHDLTTGATGSMTASVQNGFAQVNYDPKGKCTETPYAFHPMYATSSEQTRVPWAAHSYNVAFSDEIGHFEYCGIVENGGCNDATADGDDEFCFSAAQSLLVPVSGCTDSDTDFDGPSYQPVWPGTLKDFKQDAQVHSTPIVFSSPRFNGSQNYSRIAFEADLPRIEAADFGGSCNRTTGAGCVNPPPGAQFYPIYTTGTTSTGACVWRFGGTRLKETTSTFGGTSTAEFGPLLQSVYPTAPFVPVFRYNNFRNVLGSNPCPA